MQFLHCEALLQSTFAFWMALVMPTLVYYSLYFRFDLMHVAEGEGIQVGLKKGGKQPCPQHLSKLDPRSKK